MTAGGGQANCLREAFNRVRVTSDAVRKQDRGIHELINDNISVLTRWMSFLFDGKTVFPVLVLIPRRSPSVPLSDMAEDGNNAYWVKTNLYTNL